MDLNVSETLQSCLMPGIQHHSAQQAYNSPVSVETGALLALMAVCCYLVSNKSTNEKEDNCKAPPCIPRLPLVGSLPFLSNLLNFHLCMTEKCKKYGKIFSVYAGSRHIVVLSSHELIREALQKNSSEYASRGEIYMERYVWSDPGKGVILSQASDTQRKLRSNCLTVLKSFGFGSRATMEVRIHEEVGYVLDHIRAQQGAAWYPDPIMEHSTMNVIYNLMFSRRFSYEDAEGCAVRHLSRQLVESVDAVYDIFPFIAHLPIIKQKLQKTANTYNKYLDFCATQVEQGLGDLADDSDNFVKEFAKLDKEGVHSKRDLAVVVRDLMIAGTETTSGQMSWALLLLANNPHIQQRAQQEIDAAVPRDRLPSLDDKNKLPYLEAIIQEVLRIRTAVPLGVPRRTLSDTVVGGYEIPANTEVITNIWAAHMDEEIWEEPEKFNPDRFLDESGNITNKELMLAFSVGKRSCLGEVLARQEMFLFLAAILQQFQLLPPEGEEKVKDEAIFIRTLIPAKHDIRFLAR